MARRDPEKYRVRSQQAMLAVIEALAHNPFEGMAMPQLVRALPGLTRDQIYRSVANLQLAGWAEEVSGGFRLTPKITTISQRVSLALRDLHTRYLGAQDE